MQSKLPHVGDSIFSTMSQMARDHGAVDLSQGFPDFTVDPELVAKVNAKMQSGKNQYATSNGIPELRSVIADIFSKAYGRSLNPDSEVTITSGATEAICAAICALVNPGEEVIIFDPSYDSYEPLVKLNHGVPIRVRLNAPDFRIDWGEVKDKITNRTKAVVINSPHNPSGTILSKQDLLDLQTMVTENNLYVISDEVYHHIVFDGKEHESVLKYNDLFLRSIVAFSFGKMYHVTGWKVGFAIAPPNLTSELRKVHQFLTFSVHTPTQYALTEAMEEGLSFSQLSQFFQRKRDLFIDNFDNGTFQLKPAAGTYFQLLSYDENVSDVDMTHRLIKEFKVAGIPISVFYEGDYDPHTLRFCFAKTDETILKGVEILNQIRL